MLIVKYRWNIPEFEVSLSP